MKKAIIVSVQFLIDIPKDVFDVDAPAYGVDWLNGLVGSSVGIIDYRHPKIAGIYLRPVPVRVKDVDANDIFEESNLIQL